MSHKQDIENAAKAEQSADRLLQDLQELNRDGGALLSMLVLPEIEKVSGVRARLRSVIAALEGCPRQDDADGRLYSPSSC